MTKGKKALFGIIVSLLLAALVFPAAVLASPDAVVSIENCGVATGGTVTSSIRITGVTNLGAADIWLSYNKDVVTVDSVADGNLGSITKSIDNVTGVLKMNWFSAEGKTGDFVFANVTFHAVGSAGATSTLDLAVKELVDKLFAPIAHTVTDGLFTVSPVVTTYTLTASAGAGGTISPSGQVVVNSGASQAFTIGTNTGYNVAAVLVDGSSVGAVTSYTFTNVTATHTIAATFVKYPVLLWWLTNR